MRANSENRINFYGLYAVAREIIKSICVLAGQIHLHPWHKKNNEKRYLRKGCVDFNDGSFT